MLEEITTINDILATCCDKELNVANEAVLTVKFDRKYNLTLVKKTPYTQRVVEKVVPSSR